MQSNLVEQQLDSLRDQFLHYLNTDFLKLSIRKFPGALRESTLYSLQAGGKRIRPALILEAASLLNIPDEKALAMAAALECLHTYSLVHDDLPSMDNDTLRRGKPTNHVKFGEAVAILAGDALQTLAFEALAGAGISTQAIYYFSVASGGRGMVGGQVLDIKSEGTHSIERLRKIHSRKTARLIECALSMPFIEKFGPGHNHLFHAQNYGLRLGKLFQITDDLLDVTGDSQITGKTMGKDTISDKLTYVSAYGVSKAKQLALALSHSLTARAEIHFTGSNLLCHLPAYILERNA